MQLAPLTLSGSATSAQAAAFLEAHHAALRAEIAGLLEGALDALDCAERASGDAAKKRFTGVAQEMFTDAQIRQMEVDAIKACWTAPTM